MFEAAESMRAEYAELEAQMSDPAVLSDVKRSRVVGRRYAEQFVEDVAEFVRDPSGAVELFEQLVERWERFQVLLGWDRDRSEEFIEKVVERFTEPR